MTAITYDLTKLNTKLQLVHKTWLNFDTEGYTVTDGPHPFTHGVKQHKKLQFIKKLCETKSQQVRRPFL